jgi:hypothetical protein
VVVGDRSGIGLMGVPTGGLAVGTGVGPGDGSVDVGPNMGLAGGTAGEFPVAPADDLSAGVCLGLDWVCTTGADVADFPGEFPNPRSTLAF